MALKVSCADACRACRNRPGATCASVVRNPSMVAIWGSIIPEPLAIPPILNDPCGVSTVMACSFGNGSVVMMARAASLPLEAERARAAARIPATTRSMFRVTPITPVLATSTSSGVHPTAAAVSTAIMRAWARPTSPVHAFAHPLLTTTARAMPCVSPMCRRDTMTGAACARFVVKSAAADAEVSAARMARSSAVAAGLMPQCTPAVVNPAGAVMPPFAGVRRTSASDAASAMQRGQRHECLVRAPQLPQHRILPATSEVWAGVAVGHDFFRQPHVRHHRKPELDEIGRGVREGTQLLEAGGCRPLHQLVDQLAAQPQAARVLADHERSHLADITAEWGELGAGDDAIVLARDNEAIRVDRNLPAVTRKQVTLGKMRRDQCMDGVRIVGPGAAKIDTVAEGRSGRRGDGGERGSGSHTCTSDRTVANTVSRVSTARSMSAIETFNGGSRRTTFSSVRLTSRPRSRAPSITGVASTVNWRPRIRPAPRTSTMTGCCRASVRSRRSKCAPAVLT